MSVKRISIGSGTTVCYADDGQAVAYEDYADVEKLCRQQHEALVWCADHLHILAVDKYPGVSDEMRTFTSEKNARSVIAAYTTLFPKTGGAK